MKQLMGCLKPSFYLTLHVEKLFITELNLMKKLLYENKLLGRTGDFNDVTIFALWILSNLSLLQQMRNI